MIELYDNLSQKEAETCSLVLNASYIPHRVKRRNNGFVLLVDDHNHDTARFAIEQYHIENRMDICVSESEAPEPQHGYAGLWIAVFLGVFHFYLQNTVFTQDLWQNFGASAARINDGELFRTITALMLHADYSHLAGNMLGMAIFGTAVAQVAGWGVGFLLILLAGTFGNLINAIMIQDNHLSIGASTAVFGAVGILSAYQFVRKRKKGGHRSRPWLPILGGIALLGFLGTGARVDLGAHLFGFLAGLIVGVFFSVYGGPLRGERAQWVCACIALGLVLFSWLTGYLGA